MANIRTIKLKTFLLKAICFLFWNEKILCLLNRYDPHVCEILVSGGEDNSKAYTVECCLNYYEEYNKCKPCKPGKYGRQCSETCLYGYYGSQCKEICSCTKYEHCDPVSGCKCIDFTGKHCRFRCPEGYYGEHCGHVCQCLRGISCDSVTGSCLCPVGLTGPTCSTRCSDESYGRNCSKRCQCSQGLVCHSVLGTCQCENGTNDCKKFCTKTESWQQ